MVLRQLTHARKRCTKCDKWPVRCIGASFANLRRYKCRSCGHQFLRARFPIRFVFRLVYYAKLLSSIQLRRNARKPERIMALRALCSGGISGDLSKLIIEMAYLW